MSINRRVTVNKIEVAADGSIGIRFALQLIEGDSVLETKWHRTAISKGRDVGAQFSAVNQHLAEMGWPSAGGVESVEAIAKAAWAE